MMGGGHKESSARWESDVLVERSVKRSDWMEGQPTHQYYRETLEGRHSHGTDKSSAAFPGVSEPGLQGSMKSYLKNHTILFLSGPRNTKK